MAEVNERLSVRCRAKINTILRVLGRRPDGFHELDTEFVSLELHDTLHVERAEGFTLTVSGADPSEVPVQGNLVLKAAGALQGAFGPSLVPGAAFHLEKRIPAAAGLGGGSSDAAGALLGLCKLYGLRPAQGQLESLALDLGSDVPYFLKGGRQRGRGRGELLEELPKRPQRPILLLFPDHGLSTKAVFETHAELALEAQGGLLTTRKTVPTFDESWWKLSDFSLWNDLQAAALKVAPGLAELETVLRIRFPQGRVGMTGSGPTWFVIASESGGGSSSIWPDWLGPGKAPMEGLRVFETRTVDGEEYRTTHFVGRSG